MDMDRAARLRREWKAKGRRPAIIRVRLQVLQRGDLTKIMWLADLTHDLTAARAHVLAALYWAASQLDHLPNLADGGYKDAAISGHTPVKQPTDGRELDVNTRTYNALLRGPHCLGERGFALLVGHWRAPRHITTGPRKIDDIVKAALALTHVEHGRLA